jgi:hypothetical protein
MLAAGQVADKRLSTEGKTWIAETRGQDNTVLMLCYPSPTRRGVAKRLECDEDKVRFEVNLGKLAKAKTSTRPKQ